MKFLYIESTSGLCLIVGDELWFYYSAYADDPKRITKDWSISGMYANGADSLAALRGKRIKLRFQLVLLSDKIS